jgi:hypothetical protein
LIILIILGEKVMKLHIIQFSPTSCHFIPFWSKYFQHPILKRPQPMFLFNVRDQVSHPYRTTGKIAGKEILQLQYSSVELSVFRISQRTNKYEFLTEICNVLSNPA